MDLQMNGKAALVTGASVGIGKAIAFALAREGVDVAICARRPEPLEAAASQFARETNRKIVAIPADLTKPADAEGFVKEAHTALGRVDILVNNAGSSPGGVLEFLRRALGAVIAAQIHGLCAVPEARVADHAEAGARPRRQPDWQ